jgi:hypothetical protein
MTFEAKLSEGQAYEGYISAQLVAEGHTVTPHVGKGPQLTHGDLRVNGVDLEVKFDKRLHLTGNLFIEVKERHSTAGAWIASGVFASSSAAWYCIGDYVRAWWFRRACLRTESDRHAIFKIQENTSQGWLLKPAERDRFAARVRRWTGRTPLGDVATIQEPAADEIRW